MKDTDHVTNIDFFDFWGVFHRFSIHIRIEVHFCSFALGNERTLVTYKSCEARKCPFISKCKRKSVLQSLNESEYMYEGILKVMHIHPYNFRSIDRKKDECINGNVNILGFNGIRYSFQNPCQFFELGIFL